MCCAYHYMFVHLFQISSSKKECHLNDLGTNFINIRHSYERNSPSAPSYVTLCSRDRHLLDDLKLMRLRTLGPIEFQIFTMTSSDIYIEFNADEAPKEKTEIFQIFIEAYDESSQFIELWN